MFSFSALFIFVFFVFFVNCVCCVVVHTPLPRNVASSTVVLSNSTDFSSICSQSNTDALRFLVDNTQPSVVRSAYHQHSDLARRKLRDSDRDRDDSGEVYQVERDIRHLSILHNLFGGLVGFRSTEGEDGAPSPARTVLGVAMCSLIRTIPGDKNVATALCACQSAAPFADDRNGRCETARALERALVCTVNSDDVCSEEEAPVFFNAATVATSDDAQLNLPLQRFNRVTPPTIDRMTVEAEGSTYYVLWKSIMQFSEWMRYHRCISSPASGKEKLPNVLSPYWRHLQYISALQGNLSIPFADVVYRGAPGDISKVEILVVIRGTSSQFEWILNFSIDHVDVLGVGQAHSGFYKAAKLVLDEIQNVTATVFGKNRVSRAIFTGHSLGGGVSGVLAALFARQFPEVEVDAVLFAPPRFGDAVFNSFLAKNANVRALIASMDPVPELPCQSMLACTGINGRKAEESAAAHTKVVAYADAPGLITFGVAELGPDWERMETYRALVAWHSCAYQCFLSKHFAEEEPDTYCHFGSESGGCPYLVPKQRQRERLSVLH